MGQWLEIAKLDDIPALGARVLSIGNLEIALFRTGENQIFALEDKCPHLGGPLSQGIVHGRRVTCPLHNWDIDLGSGQALGADEGCSNFFPVRLEDERIYISLARRQAAV